MRYFLHSPPFSEAPTSLFVAVWGLFPCYCMTNEADTPFKVQYLKCGTFILQLFAAIFKYVAQSDAVDSERSHHNKITLSEREREKTLGQAKSAIWYIDQLRSTKRPKRPQKTSKSQPLAKSRTLPRRQAYHRRGLQSRHSFMNVNREGLQHGENHWLLSRAGRQDQNLPENNSKRPQMKPR